MKIKYLLLAIPVFLGACSKSKKIEISTDQYHAAVDNVTQIMLHDIFSPPVASRIFVYPNIAAYEVIAQNNADYQSLQKQLNDLDSIPNLEKKLAVNQQLAALVAHMEVSKALVFSEDVVVKFRDSLYKIWKNQNQKEFEVSEAYGMKVADRIKKWMAKDNYKQTRTYSKYVVKSSEQGRWQPTPPAYMDAVEPHWNEIRTLVLDSASQFKPQMPVGFSKDKKSVFFKNAQAVYDSAKLVAAKGDACDEVQIAQFWDCNPYATVTQGHMTFAKKKITPGGHWIGITAIVCKKSKADFNKTVMAYTKISIGLFDGFISCWDEKFRSNVVRPETFINQNIDENWKPLLQTPPFPEYTSGHSVVSNTSAVILSEIFGDNFEFTDTTELVFGLPARNYNSFDQAAKEAAISRFYGGIHYMQSITNGSAQGSIIGKHIVQKINMAKK